MSRLSRFEEYRYVGTRDDMKVYDCDDAKQFETLQGRVTDEDLVSRTLLQSFAPDTVVEARNRGFKPVL
ncbi:MAG: hypothetical protein PVF87_04000 [Acidimicrobiia bacterium]|jgi:hypothetical protein